MRGLGLGFNTSTHVAVLGRIKHYFVAQFDCIAAFEAR